MNILETANEKVANVLLVMILSYILQTGKIFTWSTLLRDHTHFITILPNYLFAYIRPGYKLLPTTIEAIMLTVNSYNTWYDIHMMCYPIFFSLCCNAYIQTHTHNF